MSSAVRNFLMQALIRKMSAAHASSAVISEETNLFDVGAIDSQALLELILEVEESCGCTFDPERIDFESGITLSKLVGAFVAGGPPTLAPPSMPVGEGSGLAVRAAQREARGSSVDGRSTPLVRPVAPADVEPLCSFLEHGFADSEVKSTAWSVLFNHRWDTEACNRGFVLTADDEIVGFLGTVQTRRRVKDKSGLVCNISSWCVRSEYRGWGFALLAAAVRDPGVTYTDFTAAPTARHALAVLGFAKLDTCRILMPPLLHAETFRGARPAIHFDPCAVRNTLDEQQRRMFDEHAPYDCLQLVIRDGPDYAYLVVKRRVRRCPRRLRWLFPAKVAYSEILHCSAPQLVARHLERVKLTVLRKQRTIALVADARFWPVRPRGLSIEGYACYRSPIFDAGDIDKLYSELVLLPI